MTRAPAGTGASRSGDFREGRLDTTAAESSQAGHALNRVIASIPKNRSDRVRVEIGSYNGKPTISARIWFTAADGSERPTAKGITLHVRHLPALARAFATAELAAREAGLLDADESDRRG